MHRASVWRLDDVLGKEGSSPLPASCRAKPGAEPEPAAGFREYFRDQTWRLFKSAAYMCTDP